MIYIAGAITNKSELQQTKNTLRFFAKAKELRDLNIETFNPVEDELEGKTWEEYLAKDLEIIFSKEITGIYLMKGWKDSIGARLEYQACLLKQLKDSSFKIIEER